MRGRSYTPSPPRVHGRRGRSPSPRGGPYRARSRDLPSSLFVRNLSYDCRQEDLRKSFKQFGPLKEIHLPRDHHTGDPRGYGFVQFEDPADAAEAKDHMDGYVLLGRRLAVVFARDRGNGRFRDRRRSSPRYYSGSPSSSRSPPPSRRHHHSSRRYGRRRRSYSRSPAYNGSRGRSESPATRKSRSISRSTRRSISRSPTRNRSPSPRRRRSDTPLPARKTSPRPRRSSNTPLPASRSRRRRRSNTPVPARSRSPRGEQ